MSGLFAELPEQREPANTTRAGARAGARLREPARGQIRLEMVDLDALLPDDHPVRLIWAYVEKVDFSAFEAQVRAREGRPGMPQTSPRLLLALWLYAITDGLASARAIVRLCQHHPAYLWLCGGVGVNHHTLSDFRSAQGARIAQLLAEHVASLSQAGLIDLEEVVQDGVKVRARAGAASFRRRKSLEEELRKAETLVADLAREEQQAPGAGERRRHARRARAARERAAQVSAALAALEQVEALRAKRARTNAAQTARQGEARASTSDPQARVMRMADGGYRPAYNVQFASLALSGIVVGVQVSQAGTDKGLAEPMAASLGATYGQRPRRHVVDTGYQVAGDIEAAHAAGTAFYCPPQRAKSGRDAAEARPGDGPGVAVWRARMATREAAAVSARRGRCEMIHAWLRNLGLDRVLVRGRAKVEGWMAAFGLAMNILTAARLRAGLLARAA
jgi:transposase